MKKLLILIILFIGSPTIQPDAQASVWTKATKYVGRFFGKEGAKEITKEGTKKAAKEGTKEASKDGAKEVAKDGSKKGVKKSTTKTSSKLASNGGAKTVAKKAGRVAAKNFTKLSKQTVKKGVSKQIARNALRRKASDEIKNAGLTSFFALSKKYSSAKIETKPLEIFSKKGKIKYEKTYGNYLKKGAKRKPALNKKAKATAKAERNLPKTQKELEQYRPSGNGGINAEGRTNLEIVKKPITEVCSKNALAELKTASKSSKDRLSKDFFGEHKGNSVPKPSVNGEVDLSCAKVGNFTSKCPETKDYPKLIGKNAKDITQDDIRKYNYSKIINEFAKKYDLNPSEARKFIGKCDLVIHEDSKGVMYFVPNNIHRNQQLYKHNGYVSKSIKILTGRD